MRRLHAAGLAVFAILLLFSAQAGAAQPQPDKVKQTAFPIWTLALDGPRVAYASAGRIFVWNEAAGATSVVKGVYSNAKHSVNASEIAIAGRRLAWIKREQLGNTEMPQRLYTAQVGGSAHRLRRVLGYTNTDCGSGGSQIAGLVGGGTRLAVSTWKWDGDGIVAARRRLNLVTPAGLRTIASGPSAVASESADYGHIAVVPLRGASMGPDYCEVTPPTSVAVYSLKGTLLRRIDTGPVGQVALSGKRLVVKRATATPTFDVYDWTTGLVLHTWPAPSKGFDDLGVSGRLAVYSVSSGYNRGSAKLHVLDLTTGKDAVVASLRESAYRDRDLAVGGRGLVYAVNHFKSRLGKPSGKLVFVPTAELLRLVSR
jgi:hypothetical protein